jgi:hypothetical protein
MKREWDLIRSLLLQLEGTPMDLSNWSKERIDYHKAQLVEMGLADGKFHRQLHGPPDAAVLTGLTPAGHDFVEKARSDTKWALALKFVRETVKDVSKETLTEILVSMTRS